MLGDVGSQAQYCHLGEDGADLTRMCPTAADLKFDAALIQKRGSMPGFENYCQSIELKFVTDQNRLIYTFCSGAAESNCASDTRRAARSRLCCWMHETMSFGVLQVLSHTPAGCKNASS
jgi:hypothetical protein